MIETSNFWLSCIRQVPPPIQAIAQGRGLKSKYTLSTSYATPYLYIKTMG